MTATIQTESRANQTTVDDREDCAQALQRGSRSFNTAALLLPRRLRRPARAVYAWCRACDDLIDGGSDPDSGVMEVGARLDAIYAGRPMNRPEDREFARAVRLYCIPRRIPQAMLEGFVWDAENRHYRDPEALLAYAARVAGTVGIMMAMLMDVRDRRALGHAAELGLAMQLTNIARDVGEDARNGRVYLPEEWLEEEGLSRDALLAMREPTPGLARVVQRVLALAEFYYTRSMRGIASLPADCRVAIASAALIYRAIGQQVASNGHDSLTRRAVTSRTTKLVRIAAALPWAVLPAQGEDGEICFQVGFLVDAASAALPPFPTGLDGKVERFLELLESSGRPPLPGRFGPVRPFAT